MEGESKIEKNTEEELRDKGFHIERAQLPEGEPVQCEKCMKENNFEFYDEGWFVEGEFSCEKHKGDALNILKAIDEDAGKRKLEQERIIEERRKQSARKQGC